MSYRKTRRDLRRLDNVTVAAGGSPVTLVDIPVAALGANAIVGELTANVALGTPVITGAGATEAKGLILVANANGTGSDLLVTVWGLAA